jgi:acyl-CoA dehydrogenase
MPANTNEDLELFRDMVVRFLEQEVDPVYEDWENAHLMPKEFWRTMGDAGLLLTDMPEQYGTAGASFDVCVMIQDEMSKRGYISLASGYGIHSNIVAPYINNIGTDDQKAQWLPKMTTGEVVTAIAMTEPGAGSDLAGMRSNAVKDGDEWVLNGSKTFITNGVHADMIIVCAKTDPTAGSKGISLFMVDTTLPGFSRGKKIEKMGQHCSDTAELFFQDIRLPADALLGEEGKGFVYLMTELPRERIGCATHAVGIADCALKMAADYVVERKAFGQSVSQFQNTRFKLASCKTEIELSRALLEKYIELFKQDEMTTEHASIIKLASTEMSLKVIDECLQLHGGYGYTDEYPISRLYRDARVQTIYAGTSEIMREVIARSVVGR